MRLFQKIVLGFALLLTLIGNTAPIGLCSDDGSISVAGMNACAERICENRTVPAAHEDEPCGCCRKNSEPHTHLVVELDDIIQHAETLPDAPEPTAFAFCLFLEYFCNTPTLPVESACFPPPENRRRQLPPPDAGTLPLLA